MIGCMTVVVNRYNVEIQVSDPVAFTPIPISDTAVATIVWSAHGLLAAYYSVVGE